ncbi:MAG: flap endonuclease-1 [Promethearchaeota archaeon]
MGVKLKKIVEEAKKRVKVDDFSDKIVAIDAFNVLYSFVAPIRQQDGMAFTDGQGNVTSHLIGLFYRNVFLLENRIKPVYVFDGKPLKLKSETVESRREIREQAKRKEEEARAEGDMESAAKYAKMATSLEPYMIPEVKKLLSLMGIPYIDAPADGEAQASFMVKNKDAYIVASQDYDCFLFGATRLLRNLTQQKSIRRMGRVIPIEMQRYDLTEVLSRLEISHEQLVDLGILLGTDFNNKIPGVGEITALKLIKKHGSIEKIYESKPGFEEHLPMSLVQQVRKIFNEPEVTKEYDIKFKNMKFSSIIEYLCDEKDFNKERIKGRLIKLKKVLEKKRQSRLDSFF